MSIIKYILISVLAIIVTSCYNKQSLQEKVPTTKFLPNNSDIPLFTDFEIIEEDTLNFDSSSGYISNITYKSNSKINDINNYYDNNLKNLGWKKTDESINYLSFKRGLEMLKISYDLKNEQLIVKFFIIQNG